MTRYAIDAGIALRLIRDGSDADRRHALIAPSVLRSHVLSALYRDVRAGSLGVDDGRRQLDALAALKIRLLGDRVSRATAWTLASRFDWDDTSAAEYLAVAVLQADALVTDDAGLAAAATDIVPVAAYRDLGD